MFTFTYWSNKKIAHDELLFTCTAESVTEANQLFLEATGHVAAKSNWIGCVIKKVS